MKKLNFFVLAISIFLLINSCVSTENTPKNDVRKTSNVQLLDPENIIGEKLIGSDENGTYKLIVKQDGTFEYTIDKNVYVGKWEFDKNARMYRYTFTWSEGDKKQGYIMDFIANKDEISWAGHWYLTDAFKPFNRKFTIEK